MEKSERIRAAGGDVIRSYCERSTIHGPAYLADGHCLKRSFWLVVMAVMFGLAGVLIRRTVTEWEDSPVVMNFGLASIPITEVEVRRL